MQFMPNAVPAAIMYFSVLISLNDDRLYARVWFSSSLFPPDPQRISEPKEMKQVRSTTEAFRFAWLGSDAHVYLRPEPSAS